MINNYLLFNLILQIQLLGTGTKSLGFEVKWLTPVSPLPEILLGTTADSNTVVLIRLKFGQKCGLQAHSRDSKLQANIRPLIIARFNDVNTTGDITKDLHFL